MPDLRSVAGTIVVGVDGSRTARHALHWTARWAAHTNTRVTLLAALGDPPTNGEGDNLADEPDSEFRQEVRAMVEAEVEYVREEVKGVEIAYLDVWGEAAKVLIEASRHALVLVLGTRGLGGWTGLLLGGVSDKVIGHARGPVVVVPPHWKPARRDEPVMLGVDDPGSAGPSVAFAIMATRALGTTLHAVHAWEVQKGWSALATTFGAGHVRSAAEQAQRRLDSVCAMVGQAAPEVQVVPRLIEGNPAVVLAEASETARMMVVGTRGRGGLQGLVLGSCSRRLAQTSACPVAIIRERS